MQGLYLNPDTWYEERAITTWLNTRALWIDRANREVALGTGEKLAVRPPDPRHRLAAASSRRSTASASPGTGVLSTAADAMALRAYAQRVGSQPRRRRRRRPARPRGRLRAAQARPEDDRARTRGPACSRRQLDHRGGELLQDLPRRPRPRDPARGRGGVASTPTAACAALDLTDGRTPPRPDPARRGGHPAQRRARPGRAAARSTAACSSTTACAPSDPHIFAAGRRRRVPGADARACGRPRSPRPRSRPRTPPAATRPYVPAPPGDDPQGRRRRARQHRPHRGRARRRGDRPRGATAATASS